MPAWHLRRQADQPAVKIFHLRHQVAPQAKAVLVRVGLVAMPPPRATHARSTPSLKSGGSAGTSFATSATAVAAAVSPSSRPQPALRSARHHLLRDSGRCSKRAGQAGMAFMV
ncbi:hypothetical protein [Prosthecobacter sp.]|uniref:hypothetical protein n=1 Tax=Prosthecobacter sp. TaxID=1965333 RepID=UPI00248938EA|nr:hypothetical protein [Prosthecobacter sp.]MDI1313800.1 hypothetical protein [Prosthecobacter sp.]